MPDTELRIAPLTPSLRDDYLRFFDHERGVAFADNAEWAKCYCHYYHVPKAIDFSTFDATANRIAMSARIEVGEMEGYLAYAGQDVVGWVNAQPLHKLPHCWARLGVEPPASELPLAELAAIVCFVIAPSWRRRGVARALLEGTLASMAARGIRRVYAFPFRVDANDHAPTAHYHGPEALFRQCDFRELAETATLRLLYRDLAPPA
ncbi:MAG: GNAT family N-acetyltransferase [Pseudomonadota bacterium]|nr:GNAT family N-acetyltransferase [Pseudomonadota bacterium]